ncbi:MAG: carbohydrate ABC transporter permease [Actinomycetota bacterium]|nr:carbohydrate ABC transporter permease [Actinomycetota bacterium]
MMRSATSKPSSAVRWTDIARVVAVAAIVGAFLFPIFWMLATSLKVSADILARPPVWSFVPTLENYRYALGEADFGRFIVNTLIVASVSTLIVIGVGSIAAYGFARYNPGNGTIMYFILTTRMMPGIAVVIPFFVIFRDIGNTAIGEFLFLGLDRLGTLVVAHTIYNLPFAIWLLHSFFQDIPKNLENAALVDGCTRFQAFRKVVLPLAAPGIAVTAIFSFLFSWNEFLFASVLTRDAAKTITVGVSGFQTQQGILWGPLAAAASMAVIPTVILIMMLQKYIVRGLTMGAVKG